MHFYFLNAHNRLCDITNATVLATTQSVSTSKSDNVTYKPVTKYSITNLVTQRSTAGK